MTRARIAREKRLVPIPMFVLGEPPAAPGGGLRPRRRVRADEFWSVACALRATRQISDAEFTAIVGGTMVTPLDE